MFVRKIFNLSQSGCIHRRPLDEERGRCLQRNLQGKKVTFFSRLLKKKGRRTPDHRPIHTTRKTKQKKNKSEKGMVSTVLLPPGGRSTPYDGLNGEAPPERATIFRFQV